MEQTTVLKPKPKIARLLRSRWFWVGAGVVCLTVVGVLVGVLWLRHLPEDITKQFQDTPETYGVLAPHEIPKPVDAEPPAFSWVGKMDPKEFKFVASKRGVHFYPIDDSAAELIHLEDFVGYRTAGAARADGKIPIR